MGSSLGPAMTNISMTELENKIIEPLMNKNSTRKFYCWYADDKLLAVKPEDISCINKLLNSFDKIYNLPLIYFKIVLYFLDLK